MPSKNEHKVNPTIFFFLLSCLFVFNDNDKDNCAYCCFWYTKEVHCDVACNVFRSNKVKFRSKKVMEWFYIAFVAFYESFFVHL